MKDQKDVAGLRVARSVLTKRGVDTSRADVRMMHGVLHIRGQVRAEKNSHIDDLKLEMDHIARILRQKPEIRDVVLDVSYPF